MSGSARLNPDHILKLSLAAAALIAALAIGYYYIIFLPQKEQVIVDLQKQQYEDKQKAEAAASSAEAQASSMAKIKAGENKILLSGCLDSASANENVGWAQACKDQRVDMQSQLDSCTYTSGATFCNSLWASEIEKSQGDNCTLLGTIGVGLNQAYKDAKNDCYKQYGT